MPSIGNILQETLVLFHGEAIIRNLRVEIDVPQPTPLVQADKVQIQQVLINLMMNAAESMMQSQSAAGVIVVRTEISDGMVQVAVRDSGQGIEEQELQRIFEAFITTKRAGMGMGLSLCRSIMESHGGHIWAQNNPDEGTTFYSDLLIKQGELDVWSSDNELPLWSSISALLDGNPRPIRMEVVREL